MLVPLLGLLWGSSYLWIAVLADSFSPLMVILLRSMAALATIGALVVAGRRQFPRFGPIWLHLLVITITADLVPLLMLIWAQRYVASSVTAVLNSTIPLFTLLMSALLFRSEIITRERLAGIALGIVGVATLSGTTANGSAFLSPGVVAVTISSVFYGFGFVYARRYVRGDPFSIVTLQMIMTIVILLPAGLALDAFSFSGISSREWLAVLGLGTMSSGLAYGIYYQSLDRLGPTTTSYATYLSPVVALIIGWIVLRERIGLQSAAGILLIAAGVLTASGIIARAVSRLRRREDEPSYAEALRPETTPIENVVGT